MFHDFVLIFLYRYSNIELQNMGWSTGNWYENPRQTLKLLLYERGYTHYGKA